MFMQNPNNALSLRLRMRDLTHSYHEELNHHPLLMGLMQPNSLLSDYHKLLCAYFQIYQSLEDEIIRFLKATPCIFDYAERLKLPWIVEDLQFFQHYPIDYPINQANLADKAVIIPEIAGIGHLVGILYVLEGSTLGGQFISASLLKNHGLHGTQGARFYKGYGEKTALMWQDFIAFSETLNNDGVQCEAAAEAACQTFQLFIDVLDNHQHHKQQPSLEYIS